MNNADLQERANEIRDLVAEDELNRATNRLMDFCTDFSQNRNRKREVIGIRRKNRVLSDERRVYGNTDDNRKNLAELSNQILQFIDLIIDEYQKTKQKTNSWEETTSSKLKSPVSSDSMPPDKVDETDKSKTKLELDRDNFFKSKILDKTGISSNVFEGVGICKSYKSRFRKFKLSNINITLRLGEITAIVGENGNGKTTLLRIIAGELSKSDGDISYPCLTLSNTRNLYDMSNLYDIKQQIAYVPQELPKWSGLLADNLHFAASIHGITGQDNEDEVDFIVNRLGLEQYKKASWNEISGGYKMRFALAKAILSKPKLIILDEPLANLDINTLVLFLQDLRDLANSNAHPRSIIISSQHLYEVENIADNILFIKNGQAEYNGSVKHIGKNREDNCYELACDLSKEQIMDMLENFSFKRIENTGNNFIIHTPRDITSIHLLRLFLERNISLKYFRDISKSTRRLFEDKL